ncbi:MAG: hypothetical protein JSW39_26820 [Desulfobacterales bacterium]|nr:MAG: hypothetical protein JSW39_26820 [Desulfobacterales bacterium]
MLGTSFESICALLAVGLLLQILHRLDAKLFKAQPASVTDYLFKMARVTGKSEYEIFLKAAEGWPVTAPMIERDFKEYLLHETVPYYVNDFVRKNKAHVDALRFPLH